MPATEGNFLASSEPFRRPRRALKRLLRVSGYSGKPSRFPGAVSAFPGAVEATFERCRLLVSSEPFRRLRGGVEAAFESCPLPRKTFSRLQSQFGGSRGALKRLLRVADYRGKPSRFPGAISSAPGAVETAFEWCRLLRKSSLKPFRRLWGGVEVAFESCRLPRKPFSLLRSRFGGPGGR